MLKKKKEIWIILLILLMAILVVGGWFVYNHYYKIPAKTEISENMGDIQVKKAQEFTISLTSNPTTGYSWGLNDLYDKNVVKAIGNEFKAPNSAAMGASGKELWTFKGNEKGSTKLVFTYARSWENDPTQETIKTFNVTVK